ncbi:hypothetical protein IVG45_13900 [Methylomonas sp. LL1]|nr:hypothetical protein [Methylomonas sp. LL1]QPK61952.1 hypothetical protein IVG45_13900 [Methylomonas sp. LL1]
MKAPTFIDLFRNLGLPRSGNQAEAWLPVNMTYWVVHPKQATDDIDRLQEERRLCYIGNFSGKTGNIGLAKASNMKNLARAWYCKPKAAASRKEYRSTFAMWLMLAYAKLETV